MVFNLTTLSSASLGGWYFGRFFEQRQYLNEENNGIYASSTAGIRNMPGLPLFGTVSAAISLIPVESNLEMGSKVSSATRVSQVQKVFLTQMSKIIN